MRVNVYAEEMTDRVELFSKEIEGHVFTGLRLYLHLPVTLPTGVQAQGPFMHRPGDDDSAAVTFWGKRDLRPVLRKMLAMLDAHYSAEIIHGLKTLTFAARTSGGTAGHDPTLVEACELAERLIAVHGKRPEEPRG